jgi:hypothetical protein
MEPSKMNRSTRQETARINKNRFQPHSRLDSLEARALMATMNPVQPYNPSPFVRRVEDTFPTVHVATPIGTNLRQLSFLDNDGKVFTGTLRDGTTWSLTVHGPGIAIITDTSPNDGELDDPIDSIQLVGTSLTKTYVTGQVSSSPRVLTSGTMGFNRLVAEDGVASIILNGFILKETGPSPSGPPAITLLGGVQTLAFDGIEVNVNLGADETGATVQLGDPTTPLTVKPDIRIGAIVNTARSGVTLDDSIPQTTPTVSLIVNGEIHDLELVSATAEVANSGTNATVSPVAYTGRTNVRTFGINGLKVVGSAKNFTVSRTAQPFTSQFSGVDRIGHAYFGGNADAVALDVTNGQIGRLKFLRGLGNPNGTQNTSLVEAGTPLGARGYPASGLSGGVIAARKIQAQEYGPANLILQHRLDPKLKQLRTSGYVDYLTRPGNALTNATVATSTSMGKTDIVGNSKNSLIAAGYDYQAYVQGLNPVRQPSHIRPFHQRGDLIDSVIQSSYRASGGVYGTPDDLAGDGEITGNLAGSLYQANPGTGQGVGFFARRLQGRLPSLGGGQEQPSRRFQNVLYRV